jgi:hypothetical protein
MDILVGYSVKFIYAAAKFNPEVYVLFSDGSVKNILKDPLP